MTPGYIAAVLMMAVTMQGDGNAADAIAKRFKAQVVVETGLTVPASSSASLRAATIEKALDALVAEMPGSTWRRLHVQVPSGKPMPTARALADRVRMVEGQSGANLVIEKPADTRATVLMGNYSVTPAYRSELTKAQYRTVYLILHARAPRESAAKPQADERAPQDQSVVVDVFGDMLGTFFSLDPDSQQAGMQQAMSLLQTLDPGSRADFVTTMWRSMSPELKADIARSIMRYEQMRQRGP
ncbi:MAG: hypothetical protein GX446_15975 [Chthonomonadales bacterium]|nr:hypothetical protein [Chthonomonadales bacterium]